MLIPIIEIKLKLNIFKKALTNVKITDNRIKKTIRKVEYKIAFCELSF